MIIKVSQCTILLCCECCVFILTQGLSLLDRPIMCSLVFKDRLYNQSPSSTVYRGQTLRVKYRLVGNGYPSTYYKRKSFMGFNVFEDDMWVSFVFERNFDGTYVRASYKKPTNQLFVWSQDCTECVSIDYNKLGEINIHLSSLGFTNCSLALPEINL